VSYSDGGDAWVWANGFLVQSIGAEGQSGELVHSSVVASGTHEHYFNGSSTTLYATSGSFLNQYVYIPSASPPSEIMLQFHTVGGTWEHRAYWGSNSITACGTTGPTCGTNGTASRFYMGPIPSTQNAWVQLIVKADDVGVNGLYINGWAYTLYNGGVFWDESELGAASGTITVNNLLVGQKVEFYSSQGSLKVSGTVATGQTSVGLNTYGAGLNAFPYRGYLKVYSTGGSLQYSSPLMTDIWGGDTYSYNQPVFSNSFNPGPAGVVIHNLLIGSSQYQNSTSTPEESYLNYDLAGDKVQNTLMHNGSPLTTTYTYDTYGNKLSAINPVNGFSNPGFETGDFSGWSQTNMIIRGDYIHSGHYSAAPSYNPSTSVYSAFTLQQNLPLATTVTSLQFWQFDGDPNGLDTALVLYSDGTSTQTTLSYVSSWTLESLTFTKEVVGVKIVRSAGSGFNIVLDDFSITGQKTYFAYSAAYRQALLTNVTQILTATTNITTTYSYNFTSSATLTMIDPLGNRTDYRFDIMNRPISIQQSAVGGIRSEIDIIYQDALKNVVIKNQKGNYTEIDYDGLNRVTTIKEFSGNLSSAVISRDQYSYNWQGRIKNYTSPMGGVTTYLYDYLGRLTKVTNPDSTARIISYDDRNLIQSKFDENGHRTDNLYDALQRLTGVREYYSQSAYYSTTYLYDGLGNLVKKVDAIGQTTTYSFNDQNRLILTKYPDAFNETRNYDQAGNLVSKRDSNGSNVTYRYDALNRIVAIGYPDGTGATYAYDKDGDLIATSNTNSSATFSYDARNRLIGESWIIAGGTYTLGFSYDSVGNLVKLTYPDGTAITYSIDQMNRVSAVKNGAGTLATLTYNPDSTTSSIYSGNGDLTNYTYNLRGQLTRLKVVQAATTLLDLNYSYDPVGNVATINTESYSYDSLNRLTYASGPWGVDQYGYDAVGNRLWFKQGATVFPQLGQQPTLMMAMEV
jgi:YD repeat-containing protein